MKKRIKLYQEENSEVELKKEEFLKDNYVKLLITDLKREGEIMPKYSLWSELVNKCLLDELNKN